MSYKTCGGLILPTWGEVGLAEPFIMYPWTASTVDSSEPVQANSTDVADFHNPHYNDEVYTIDPATGVWWKWSDNEWTIISNPSPLPMDSTVYVGDSGINDGNVTSTLEGTPFAPAIKQVVVYAHTGEFVGVWNIPDQVWTNGPHGIHVAGELSLNTASYTADTWEIDTALLASDDNVALVTVRHRETGKLIGYYNNVNQVWVIGPFGPDKDESNVFRVDVVNAAAVPSDMDALDLDTDEVDIVVFYNENNVRVASWSMDSQSFTFGPLDPPVGELPNVLRHTFLGTDVANIPKAADILGAHPQVEYIEYVDANGDLIGTVDVEAGDFIVPPILRADQSNPNQFTIETDTVLDAEGVQALIDSLEMGPDVEYFRVIMPNGQEQTYHRTVTGVTESWDIVLLYSYSVKTIIEQMNTTLLEQAELISALTNRVTSLENPTSSGGINGTFYSTTNFGYYCTYTVTNGLITGKSCEDLG